MSNETLTAERLRELLNYDPDTGLFTHRVSRRGVTAGKIVGSKHAKGYIVIRVDEKLYLAHRLAVLWMTGVWPKEHVDHRDLNRANNVWDNIREATNAQNMANMGVPKHNTTGFKGVTRRGEGFVSQICINGRHKYLGQFTTPEDAHAAYVIAANENFGEFARGNDAQIDSSTLPPAPQRPGHKVGSTGYRGIHLQGGKYRPRIWLDGKLKSLGLFDTIEEAHAAYVQAANDNNPAIARSA
jgi:hypothetical protein